MAETFKKGAPKVWKSDRIISVIDFKAYLMLGFLDFVVVVFSFFI